MAIPKQTSSIHCRHCHVMQVRSGCDTHAGTDAICYVVGGASCDSAKLSEWNKEAYWRSCKPGSCPLESCHMPTPLPNTNGMCVSDMQRRRCVWHLEQYDGSHQ